MTIVFFIYGLAFFSLGLSISVFPKATTGMPLVRAMRYIGAFGFLHGLTEWADLALLTGVFAEWESTVRIVRTLMMALSFLALMEFGITSLTRIRPSLTVLRGGTVTAFVLWGGFSALSQTPFLAADVAGRYILAVPGTVLVCMGLVLHGREFEDRGMTRARSYMIALAWLFLAYGVLAGLVVPRMGIFPASAVNYEWFASTFGFPVQVARTICAVAIAIGIYRVLGIFETESVELLRTAREELESRVRERTEHLRNANSDLEREIAERFAAEGEAQSQRNLLESVLAASPDLICYKDRDSVYRVVNPAFCNFLGRQPRELVGRDNFGVFTPELAEAFTREDAEVVRTARPIEQDVRGYMEGFRDRWYQTLKHPVFDARGEVGGVIVAMRDITARKAAEAALRQSLADRESLIKEIHHRVKNNLMIIQSLLKMQARDLSDEASRIPFTESQNRVRAMSMIHESLYNADDLVSVSIGEYVRGMATKLFEAYNVSTDAIRLTIDIPRDVHLDIDTVIPLGLILNELISNSLKHAFPEGRTGELRITMASVGEDEYALSVRDSGVGLPPGFDIARNASMGLQLVATLARQVQGRLMVTASGGTEFRIVMKEKPRR
jgi:PAS domain S-box-containing protein